MRAVLEEEGFDVTSRADLSGAELRTVISSFINRYGRTRESRLLFFFSGHGHTMPKVSGDDLGYIVPADAPLPARDRGGFLERAVSMDQVLTWAKEIDTNHALFVFDSCFSGSVFQAMRDEGAPPPLILDQIRRPVRMFITAGGTGESVPAQSTFTPAFVDALRYRKGDLDHDGYVTGMELGFYLQGEVRRYVSQTPQYSKIKEYSLAQGDFIFSVGKGPISSDSASGAPLSRTRSSIPLSPDPQHKEPKTGSVELFDRLEQELKSVPGKRVRRTATSLFITPSSPLFAADSVTLKPESGVWLKSVVDAAKRAASDKGRLRIDVHVYKSTAEAEAETRPPIEGNQLDQLKDDLQRRDVSWRPFKRATSLSEFLKPLGTSTLFLDAFVEPEIRSTGELEEIEISTAMRIRV